jgi:two-component system, LuxR family, response regulator FixJ
MQLHTQALAPAPRGAIAPKSRSPRRTVFLVDDNAEFRASAMWWLAGAGYQVRDFGCAQTAFDTLAQLGSEAPEQLERACLLLDVRMPGLSGLDLHDRLCENGLALRSSLPTDTAPGVAAAGSGRAEHTPAPPLPVVYMTGHGDVPLAVAAMQKGAITMLEKPFDDDALERALERAFTAGECAHARRQIALAFPEAPLAAGHGVAPEGPEPGSEARLEYQRRIDSLSPRQRQVLDGIVAGKLSKQIAYENSLSGKTVEFHRKCLMEKMQARNALELVRMVVARSVDAPAALGAGA